MPVSVVFAALAAAAAHTAGATAARTAQQPALAIVFHVRPPASNDPALAAADIALRAPEEIGDPLRAMRGHNTARLAFAVCPAYLAALDRAASNDSALAASGEAVPGGSQTGTLAGILA